MKTIRQTATELILKEGSFSPGRIIFALFFFTPFMWVSLLMGRAFLDSTGIFKIFCTRIEPRLVNCSFTKTHIFNILPANTHNYNGVKGAEFQAQQYVNNQEETLIESNVNLKTNKGVFPIFKSSVIYPSGLQGDSYALMKITDSLNQFIDSQQQSMEQSIKIPPGLVTISTSLFGVLWTCMWAIPLALIIYFGTRIITLKLDKINNQMTITNLSILGSWTKLHELNEIKNIEIQQSKKSDSELCYFTPLIVMKSGKKYKFAGYQIQENAAILDVNQVRAFLNLPLLPPTIELSTGSDCPPTHS